MVIFDTNAILRYILQDNQSMADEVEQKLFDEICIIPIEVVAEIVYVLSGFYNLKRDLIAQTLLELADEINIIVVQKKVVLHALQVYASTTFDFVDCLLIGYAKEDKYEIFTFDKKLNKFLINL